MIVLQSHVIYNFVLIMMLNFINAENANSNVNSNENFNNLNDTELRYNNERRLVDYLMRNYDNTVRPLKNASKAVEIRLGITLIQIFDLDEKNQVLTTNVWLDHEWIDEFLTWDVTEFGLTKLRLPCEKIWKPDIVLYNNADDFTRGYMNSRAVIEPNGNVFWPPPTKFRSTCPVDVTYFPFDDQRCIMKLGSWIYDGLQVDVLNRTAEVDLSNYVRNGEWDLLEVIINRNVVYYPCCPEPFPDVTITIKIRRKLLYYAYNVILPCMMLSVLTLMVFCIPPDSGEKIALGVTVLLAFSVFMLAISEKLPETSESIPLLGIYLTAVMAITSVSVIMSVIVLNYHYRGPIKKEVPQWVKKKLSTKDMEESDPKTHQSQSGTNHHQQKPPQISIDVINSNSESPLQQMQRFAISSESLNHLDSNLIMDMHRAKTFHQRSSGQKSPLSSHQILVNTHEELLKISRYLFWRQHLKESHSVIVHEWRLLALWVDKILFWIFCFIILLSSISFLVIIPIQQRGFSYF